MCSKYSVPARLGLVGEYNSHVLSKIDNIYTRLTLRQHCRTPSLFPLTSPSINQSIPRLIQIDLEPSPDICGNRLQRRQHAEEIRRDVQVAVEIRDGERGDGRRLVAGSSSSSSSSTAAAAYPAGLDALSEAVGFGAWVLLVPGGGCRGAAGHVVGAVEAADDEVGVEALELAVD